MPSNFALVILWLVLSTDVDRTDKYHTANIENNLENLSKIAPVKELDTEWQTLITLNAKSL